MRFLLASAHKDLRRRLTDPLALVIWVGFPVLLGILVSLLSGSGGDAPTARILLVDQDESPLSEFLVRSLVSGVGGEDALFVFDAVDLETGRERIGDGDGTALVIVPPDFGDDLLANEPTTLTVFKNPAQTMLPEIVVEALGIVRDGVFYAQQVFGEPLRQLAAGPPPGQTVFDSAEIASIAARINDRMTAAGSLFDPPLFEIDFGGDGGDNAASVGSLDTGFATLGLILPGLILMSILFTAQGMSDDLWREKDAGTLSRAFCAPRSIAALVAGKLLAALVLVTGVATTALLVAHFLAGVSLARIPVAVLWSTYSGTALFGLLLFIAMLGSTHRTADLVTMMILFPMMMIGGSFFPFDMMPAWMRAIGVWTPNGMAVVELQALLFGEFAPSRLALAAAVIGAVGGVSLWLCALRARRFIAL